MAKKDNTIDIFQTRFMELHSENYISQEALAAKVGTTRPTLSGWLSGKSMPDCVSLTKIAQHFNVSTDYLLGLTDIKKSNANLQAAVEYTGLSEEAVDCLHSGLRNFKRSMDDGHRTFFNKIEKEDLSTLSHSIQDTDFVFLLSRLNHISRESYAEQSLRILCEQCPSPTTLSSEQHENFVDNLIKVLEVKYRSLSEVAQSHLKSADERELLSIMRKELVSSMENQDLYHFKASKSLDKYIANIIRESKEKALQKFST